MAFAIVIQCYNQSKCRAFDIEEVNGLSDSLDLARTLLLDRKSLSWRLHDPTRTHDVKFLPHIFSFRKN